MPKNAKAILQSPGFLALVRKKWLVSITLTIALFVVYYGYILLIAYDKKALAQKVGEYTVGTLGVTPSTKESSAAASLSSMVAGQRPPSP